MKKKLLTRKKVLSCICCTLAAVTFCTYAPRPVMEAMYVPEYICDLRVFQSDKDGDLNTAIRQCRAAGYTPVETDLNNGTGEDYIVLGYRTTKNRDQAITDVRTLYMGLGYEEYSLKDVLEQQKEQMTQFARELTVCCKEFRKNYDAGSPHAQVAFEIFNRFQIDDLPSRPMLGDYLLSDDCMPLTGDRQDEDPKGVAVLSNVLNKASVSFTNMLYTAMISAVADYNPDKTYQKGEYEVEVVIPDSDSKILNITPEEASSIAQQIVPQTTAETTAADQQQTDNTGTGDETAESTEETTLTALTSLTESEAVTTALPETTLSLLTETQTTLSETETTADAAFADVTNETDDTDETDETDETTVPVTTEALTPNEIVKLVLNCDKNYGTWADRVPLTGMIQHYEEGEIINLFDAAYQNQALNIKAQIQDFARHCEEAAARYATYGEEMYKSALEEFDENEDIMELAEQMRQKVSVTGEMNESGADLSYLAAYQILDQYRYNDKMTLAEYIMKIGCNAYAKYEELQEMYPLLAAMTDGQIQMVRANGLLPLVMALNNTDDVIRKSRSLFETMDQKIYKYNGKNYISVYEGVKSEEQMVAVTDAHKMTEAAGAVYDTLSEPLTFDSDCDKIINGMSFLSEMAGAMCGLITLGGIALGKLLTGHVMLIGFGTCWAWMMTGGFWVAIGGLLCFTCMALGLICVAIMMLVMLIKSIVTWVRDAIGWEKDPEWKDIPGLVCDFVGGYYVNYHPVKKDGGGFGDLNAGAGKRWCALYYTRAPKIGSPLMVPEEGNPITVSTSAMRVTGYTPLREFGTVTAANLNSYVRKSGAPTMFLHFKTEKDLNVPVNEGKDANIEKEEYVTGIMLAQGKDESKVKAEIAKAGYTLYPKNLTPHWTDIGLNHYRKNYTYIGYLTSEDSKNALTDLRICPQESGDKLFFGTGGYSNVGTTANGDSLFFTCEKDMGEMVTPNFEIVRDPKTAPEGWEPVLTFGGFPYDFNKDNEVETDYYENDTEPLYLYYLPSKVYTAVNADGSAATEYLGGLLYYEENYKTISKENRLKETIDDAAEYAARFRGAKLHNYNLVGIANRGQFITLPTYNPKRAIYGIGNYIASPKGSSIVPSLGSQETGAYAVCDIRVNNFDDSQTLTNYHRPYSRDHSYGILPVTTSQERDSTYGKLKKQGLYALADDFEQEGYWKDAPYSKAESYIHWDYYKMNQDTGELRKKGLYVRGCSPDLAPLLMSEVVFTKTKLEAGKSAFAIDGTLIDPAGYYSIQDLKNPNATAPHSLSFQYSDKQPDNTYSEKQPNYCPTFYIYIKRTPVEKPYISSLVVKAYDFDTYREDDLKMSLDKIGEKEIEAFNNAGPDICVMTLLASCTDEIFPFDISKLNATAYHEDSAWYEDVGHWFANVGRDIGGWFAGWFSESTENKLERYNYAGDIVDNVRVWQDDLDKYVSNSCAYIGFSRTDNEMDAIKGIIKYKPKNGEAPQTIKVDGVSYTRCGGPKDMIRDEIEGNYFIYATKDNGATPGRPITAVTLNTDPIVTGAQTARTAATPNSKSKADPAAVNFLHAFYDDSGMYMDAVYIGRGNSQRAALCDLLDMDCCDVLLYDLHNTKDDDFAYIGITKYQPMTKTDLKAKSAAVRDIRIVTDSGFDITKRIDGRLYRRALDKYSFNNDFTQAVCLNDTNGAYLYYSTAGTETPLDRIGIAEKDRVPPTENGVQVWENVLTESGVRFNLNDSFITFSADDSDILSDNRAYLFVKRLDGSVKFGSEIVGGHCEEMQKYGELIYVRG